MSSSAHQGKKTDGFNVFLAILLLEFSLLPLKIIKKRWHPLKFLFRNKIARFWNGFGILNIII
jgi:hypothetical protein